LVSEVPKYKPELKLINIYWICGFINSDGSFSLFPRSRPLALLGDKGGKVDFYR